MQPNTAPEPLSRHCPSPRRSLRLYNSVHAASWPPRVTSRRAVQQALLELSALRQELVRNGGDMLDYVGAPSLTLGRTYAAVALGEVPLSAWMTHFLAAHAATTGLPADVLNACEGLQRSWADSERHTARALAAALEDDVAQRAPPSLPPPPAEELRRT